jgi:hypothetical protein
MRLVILLFASAFCGAFAHSLPKGLFIDYTRYTPIITNTSEPLGWAATGPCDAERGVPFNLKGELSDETPITTWMTTGGQVAGVSVRIRVPRGSSLSPLLVQKKFFTLVGQGKDDETWYEIGLSFRSGAIVCNGSVDPTAPTGTQAVVHGSGFAVPLTQVEAEQKGFVRGSCFETMGTHYFFDLAGPKLTFNADTLVPVVPMFGTDGNLNAVFFASTVVQQHLLDARMWEPVPLPPFAMCKNFCDANCHWEHTWSTLHVFFGGYKAATCPGACKIGCC